MNFIMQQLVNQKINSMTEPEFLQLARQHGYSLSPAQAKKVLSIIHSEKVDVGNRQQVDAIIHRLQTETDAHVAGIVQELLGQFEHLLK
ncbi:DUF2624 domain-containing protein [Shouchella shacheensis]|uniref:DUF2624 domain-containing protein n=1 Tax=Shouchella shacheensis TaxID=1649580 RepID=UPI00073FEF3D|nr:DUF2624 domain-containing protein [Shouchella shacheensis]